MARRPSIRNNTSAISTGATAATRVGIPVAIGGAAYLLSQIDKKRDVYNTKEAVDATLFDKNQQYFTSIVIGEYKRSLFSGGNLNPLTAFMKIATIFSTDGGYKLPLPLKLMDRNTVTWEQKSLVDAEKVAKGISTAALGSLVNSIANVPAAAQALAGQAPNEFLTMLFKGPTYKEFSLQFLISPNTPAQSMAFREMIVRFKNAMAPSLVAGGTLFAYPNVFQIKFNKKTGSGSNPFLYEFKPAVLKSFTVDYAPANVPSFYAGTDEPESFVLNMDFQEIEFWLPGDFK